MLVLDWGSSALQPNQSGQVRDFMIQNIGGALVENIFGLNFAMQVGDGTSGPRVDSVNLYAGDSIFASYQVNQVNQGSSPWILFFGIDSGGVPVSMAGTSSTLLARVTFDTTGLSSGSGPWTVSGNDVGPLGSATGYVLVGGESRQIDAFVNGTLTVVPEPAESGIAAGLLVVAFVAWKKLRLRRLRMSYGLTQTT